MVEASSGDAVVTRLEELCMPLQAVKASQNFTYRRRHLIREVSFAPASEALLALPRTELLQMPSAILLSSLGASCYRCCRLAVPCFFASIGPNLTYVLTPLVCSYDT